MIENLKPAVVFSAFEKLCMIPHGSFNTSEISRFIESYALDRGFRCKRDSSDNVYIEKDASPGYERSPAVIIQGHLDMVCVCDDGVDIDFAKDPLRLRTDGDYIYSEGTSLGGDDGIAVAYIMALLDTDAPHPKLEFLITANEEVGMLGAYAADVSSFSGRHLINIDSETQGVFTVGCAGGIESECSFSLDTGHASGKKLTVGISNMHGGHSGSDIHKGYSNAVKLLCSKLNDLYSDVPYRLISFNGGAKTNAIPSACTAELVFGAENEDKIGRWCSSLENECRKSAHPEDIALTVSYDSTDYTGNALTDRATTKFLDIVSILPDGAQSWSSVFKGTVETSLNMGKCYLEDGKAKITFLIRSLIDAEMERISDSIRKTASDYGGSYNVISSYSAWERDNDSELCDLMLKTYRDMTGTEPKTEVIHAGLECGIFKSKLPGLQCVSIGPDILDIHTPKERLSISSASFMWDYLLELLKRCK